MVTDEFDRAGAVQLLEPNRLTNRTIEKGDDPCPAHRCLVASLLLAAATVAEAQAVGNRVEVNGMTMYYEVTGEGEPIVVLHGAYMNIPSMGADHPAPRRAPPAFYALEFQGHGRTEDIDRPITYPNLADDVAAFMDAVDLPKADVFGYSMGAGTALQLAIRHPEKVDHLVNASGGFDTSGMTAGVHSRWSRR